MARILIADDDAHIVRVMSMWLNRHGHETLCAADGREALKLVRSRRVDLIISDVNMPQLDGLGLVKAVRESAESGSSQIPILVLSARCDQRSLMQTLAAYGVSVYPKPFLPSHLVAEIDRLLAACCGESSADSPREVRDH